VVDISTRYLGLSLPSPVMVGACGLTQSVEGVKRCADAGAGAVVLKSLFEEEILAEVGATLSQTEEGIWHPEALDYVRSYGREHAIGQYLDTIDRAKRTVGIPVIASIHCSSPGAWAEFATKVALAGADAIELNVFVLPSDFRRDPREYEEMVGSIASKIKEFATIPVALKLGTHFSGLGRLLQYLGRQVDGLVLFNRFFRFDIDVDAMALVPGSRFSSPQEIEIPLRWVSLLSGRVPCSLCGSTGVHDADGVVKLTLAGAHAVQVCSAVYQHGHSLLGAMNDGLRQWMDRHGFATLAELRGRLAQKEGVNPATFARVQFMKMSADAADD
jgi:dihydroorotate dehydrogenase (fumarate)